MKISVAKIILVALMLILIPSTAGAQTPDGQTPAQETVCDQYTGRTYGICNAYYEAMDCDNPTTQASAQACANLKVKFEALTAGTSSGTATSCPCYGDLTQEGFTQNSTCSNGENVALIFDFSSSLLMAQAGATSSFMGCDFNGVTQEPLPSDQALACVNIITAFCDALP